MRSLAIALRTAVALMLVACAPSEQLSVLPLIDGECGPVTPAFASRDTVVFLYDRTAPLDVRDSLRSLSNGVEEHAISFASPRGGRTTGLLWVPQRSGPLAGVLMQHGLPGRATHMSSDALAIATRGAVVIAIDAPFARRDGDVLRFTAEDSIEQVQLIVDLQRATDMLLARSDVDPARLGYVGVSYGGAMGALLAGIERRLRTFILVVGDGGLVAHFTGADDANGPLSTLTRERRCNWLAAMRPIEPLEFVHRAPPASILFQSGRLDVLVPQADAGTLHAAARAPKTITWYDAGHGLNAAARDERLDWLRTMIGIDAR